MYRQLTKFKGMKYKSFQELSDATSKKFIINRFK